MSRENRVRKSREPVRFDHHAKGWDLRESMDSDSVPKTRLAAPPPPIRALSPILHSPNPVGDAARLPVPVRYPIVDVTHLVLCAEIGKLEQENRALGKENGRLKSQNVAYEKVVAGLCRLHSEQHRGCCK